VDPTDIAREYQQIRRPDERRQFGAKAKRQGIAPRRGWLTFPDFDMHVTEIDDSHGGHSVREAAFSDSGASGLQPTEL
jgi:hypothetical protein